MAKVKDSGGADKGELIYISTTNEETESAADDIINSDKYETADMTITAASLTVDTAATNLTLTATGDTIISPGGTGSFQLYGGGNTRGDNAVDFQGQRGNATQVASGNDSVLLGRSSTASGSDSVAFGGFLNVASGSISTVVGGQTNVVDGANSAIFGGALNTINTVIYASITGGFSNSALGNYATVLGGYQNTASHQGSIACGAGAQTTSNYDFVIGGAFAASSTDNVHFRCDVDGKLYLGHTTGTASAGGLFLQSQTTIGQQASFVQGAALMLDCVGNFDIKPTGNIISHATILPNVDNTRFLGSGGATWNRLYLGGSIVDSSNNFMPATTITSFRDANVGVADGMGLFWDNASSKWLPATPSGGSLDAAYTTGGTITKTINKAFRIDDATDGDTVDINKTSGNGNAIDVNVSSTAVGFGIRVRNSSGGHALDLTANSSGDSCLKANHSTTFPALDISSTSTGQGMRIASTGSFGKSIEINNTSGSQAIDVNHSGALATAAVTIDQTNTGAAGPGIIINSSGIGAASELRKTASGTNSVLFVDNLNASNGSPIVDINNLGTGAHLRLRGTTDSVIETTSNADLTLKPDGTGVLKFLDGSEGTAGDVWTSSGTGGEGSWSSAKLLPETTISVTGLDITGATTGSKFVQAFSVGTFPAGAVITEYYIKVTTAATGDVDNFIRVRMDIHTSTGTVLTGSRTRLVQASGFEGTTVGDFGYGVGTAAQDMSNDGTGAWIRITDSTNASIATGILDVKLKYVVP